MNRDRKQYKILVVEDNPGDFTIVEDLLFEQILNPIIRLATNFKSAEAVLRSENSGFDIILLDLTLPDKDGKALVSAILELAVNSPVIILTGYTDVNFSIHSISDGISDYLLKDELSSTILYKSLVYAIERKKNTIKLLESEKRYSDLFHLSPLPMWVYDFESLKFLKVNNAAIRNYGYSEEEFLSMSIIDIRPAEDIHLLEKDLEIVKKKKLKFTFGIYRHKKKNGEIMHVEVQASIFHYNKIAARLILANDITKRVEYINAIEDQNKILQEIAWVQSHVVRAPLARMMGLIELIKAVDTTTEDRSELINFLADSSVELDTIIRDIVKKAEGLSLS